MKHEALILTGLLIAVLLFGACHKQDLIQPSPGEMYMRFVDSGAVAPSSVVTTVMIEHDRIQENSFLNGTPIGGWATSIESKDYQRLIGVAMDNNLGHVRQLQVGQGPCVGAREMSVIITFDGLARTITVPGTARCDTSKHAIAPPWLCPVIIKSVTPVS